MRTTRLLLMLGLLTAALAVAPQAASALGTVSLQSCSPNVCDGSTWVNSDVSVTYNWTDDANVLSVAGDCTGADPNTGILTVSAEGDHQLTCTVTYVDGQASAPPVEVKIDKTPPVPGGVTTTVLPSLTGWFTAPFSVDRTWSDALSGINASDCETDAPYSGGESGGATVSMDCRDNAGNLSAPVSFPVKYDSVKPDDVDGTAVRPPDQNGWYNHPVSFAYHADPELAPGSGIAACDTVAYPGPLITAPDSPAATVTGGCSDIAGNSDTTTDAFQYDGTPPTVTGAAPDRAPDHGDWYTHPVRFAFQGTDATSGLGSCSSATYSGPDSAAASLKGTCSDVAGNASATKSVSFKYDATPPAKAKLFATPANKAVDLSWAPPSDGASFVVTRTPAIGGAAPTPVYRGGANDFVDTGLKNGTKYNYLVTVYDAAGNASPASGVSAVPDGSTLRPFIDTEVSNPPLLTWQKAKKATYYNLQLYKGRRKILSVWPKTPGLQLKKTWKFQRRRYSLSKGLYRWYVWPGLGRQSAHRYGTLMGSSTFRVV